MFMKKLKSTIKLVMSGLQQSNFPISYDEQTEIQNNYMEILHKEEKPDRRIRNSDFVGPQSVSLEMVNISSGYEDTTVPNIRKPYTVTDKADGIRKLMFIAQSGKIYLIDVNMRVQFTGVITQNEELFNTIIDGEHVLHNKTGDFINLYLAFDIYYKNGSDVRMLEFINNSELKLQLEKKRVKLKLIPLKNIDLPF